MKIKLIACDLDGTLLDSNGLLSNANSIAITKLVQKGILFVPSTGRGFYEIPEAIRNHQDIRYFITSNGAVIYDNKNGDRVECLIDGNTARELYQKMKKCDFWLISHKNDRAFTDAARFSKEIMDKYNIPEKFRNQLYEYAEQIDNFDYKINQGEPIEMLCGCFASKDRFIEFENEIKDLNNIHCTGSAGFIVEVVNEKAGKHNAVRNLIQKLGFSTDEIITVGDSRNDLEMLKMTKNSIAVSNSSDLVKENVGYVGCSNDENIIQYIANNLI